MEWRESRFEETKVEQISRNPQRNQRRERKRRDRPRGEEIKRVRQKKRGWDSDKRGSLMNAHSPSRSLRRLN